ncbi:phosphate/phosphite/phosphonate ABC transporter substrate-binding protein [Pseudomarimonas arenosa]|uniref:PhnD/SsuA/transferrin family substrate-binding protein n=1 Tax=Pseudomarimonas arenosa TaxID=2774145 RepID=A0AAW3ZJ64_9GAMM|nr:PhnD/SsuA/transferrin family substrate-binding protein [Pseudomarimonas arenosa]MBD8525264.1 PhnD/SsuA/transferrin family substrate-binding protein [Pseudomarimonas arenosa]
MRHIVASGLLALGLASATWQARADTYTVTVEPSYPPDQAAEVYQPLFDYLGKETGHTFKILATRNYHFYWRDLRQSRPTDFAFEEAHFTDYRAKRAGFEPLAKKTERAVFVLLVSDPELADAGLNALVGRRIVSMPAPSMGFALAAEMYKNPIAQPEIRSEASTWRDGVEMVFSGDAEAAMVPVHIADQYPNLVEVSRSKDYPGAAFSAGPTVPDEVKAAVKAALLKLSDDPSAFEILAELGATGFVEVAEGEYDGQEKMLAAFFGYRPPQSVE